MQRLVIPNARSLILKEIPVADGAKLVCNLEFQGFMDDHLNFVAFCAKLSAQKIGIPTSKIIHLPVDLKKFHTNKGPFVHAKTKEVFERRTFKRLIQAFDSHPDTINGWISFINDNLPSGINLKATRFEYQDLAFFENIELPKKELQSTHTDKVNQEIEAYLKKFTSK